MTNIGSILSVVGVLIGLLVILIYSLKGRDIDRRIIFLFIFLSVAFAIVFNIKFKETPTPIVRAVFEKIDSMPPGSKILISFDFDPAMKPEVGPMANAFVRHCMSKGHKMYFMTLWATGHALMTESIEEVLKTDFPDAVYGVDFTSLGFKAGGVGVLNVIVTDFQKMYPTDDNNTELSELPIFKNVNSATDMDLILAIGGGFPGPKEWIQFIGDPGNVDIAAGLAAVVAPQIYPYYPRQVVGLLGGVKGAAEYESKLMERYPQFKDTEAPALRMMGPQTLAHIVVMAFIVIGNISYFRSRRKNIDA
ncbi:MAG: hypothetical protein ABIE07_10415 [Candidatus Zixiibacteriota bacterium]